MRTRRLQHLLLSGDRGVVVAIDGNAQMHRRTCGMSSAELLHCLELGKILLRGCPNFVVNMRVLWKLPVGRQMVTSVTLVGGSNLRRPLAQPAKNSWRYLPPSRNFSIDTSCIADDMFCVK